MPTARQPLILAICPTTLPTDPAAPDTTTVCPGSGRPTSSSPKYAVRPLMPSTPRCTGAGAGGQSELRVDESCHGEYGRDIEPGTQMNQAADELSSLARELAPKIETARRLPDELVEGLRASGLFRAGAPAAIGAPEAPP